MARATMRTRSSAHGPDAPKSISTTLPLELLELIFRSLQSSDTHDRPTKKSPLKATSLVCRSWRVPSQRLLFYSLPILFLLDFAPRLSGFLLSAPFIASAVREVQLSGTRNTSRWNYESYSKEDSDAWAHALRLLQNVRYLTVSHFQDGEMELVVDLIQSIWSSTMTHLAFIDCAANCFHIMLEPLSSCTNLRTLDFRDADEVKPYRPDASPPECCANAVVRTQLNNLQKIAINVTTSAAVYLMRWLSLPNVSKQHLKHLELSFCSDGDMEPLFELLSNPLVTLWTRVKKLTLNLQDPRSVGGSEFSLCFLSSPFYLPLRQFANLEMFTYRLQPNGLIDAVEWWEIHLRHHASLQTLSLSFRWVAARTSKRLRLKLREAWDRLDMTLSQDAASLREVKFVDEERRLITDANPDLVELIREVLPQSSNKGLLSFS